MKVVKTIRCAECGGLLELDKHHLSQKRHIECSYKHTKKLQEDYRNEFIKRARCGSRFRCKCLIFQHIISILTQVDRNKQRVHFGESCHQSFQFFRIRKHIIVDADKLSLKRAD